MLLHPHQRRRKSALMENEKQPIKPQKPRKKVERMIKNSDLSRVARLLNEFLMLQLGAKAAFFPLQMLGYLRVKEHRRLNPKRCQVEHDARQFFRMKVFPQIPFFLPYNVVNSRWFLIYGGKRQGIRWKIASPWKCRGKICLFMMCRNNIFMMLCFLWNTESYALC